MITSFLQDQRSCTFRIAPAWSILPTVKRLSQAIIGAASSDRERACILAPLNLLSLAKEKKAKRGAAPRSRCGGSLRAGAPDDGSQRRGSGAASWPAPATSPPSANRVPRHPAGSRPADTGAPQSTDPRVGGPRVHPRLQRRGQRYGSSPKGPARCNPWDRDPTGALLCGGRATGGHAGQISSAPAARPYAAPTLPHANTSRKR